MFQHLVESLPRRVEAVIAAMFQHLVESLPWRVEAVIAAKGGDQLHVNAHDFGMRCSFNRCPHTSDHVVYFDLLQWVKTEYYCRLYKRKHSCSLVSLDRQSDCFTDCLI
jgi:hypothetical protein